MSAWRPAKSLTTLLNQVNKEYPKRSKASDGLIGDQSHASGPSDHNPNSKGVVCALDITHDPKNGVDTYKMADSIRKKPTIDLKYIISNRKIAERENGFKWRPYGGSNPHDHHMHVSVGRGPDGQSVQPYDNKVKWNIEEEDMLTTDQLNVLFRLYRGDSPSILQRKKYVGKITFEQMKKKILAGRTFKNEIKKAKVGKLDCKKHLPTELRKEN